MTGDSAQSTASLIEAMLPAEPPMHTPEALPTTATVLQARENALARAELVREFGYLTADQVALSNPRSRADATGAQHCESTVSVSWHGRRLYPAFQFGPDRTPLTVVGDALRALPRDRMSDWDVALWWTAANGWLHARRPVDVLQDDPESVVRAASRLAQPSPL